MVRFIVLTEMRILLSLRAVTDSRSLAIAATNIVYTNDVARYFQYRANRLTTRPVLFAHHSFQTEFCTSY
ncbi:MAG: hypothetical protein CLLPBCKN_007204 [Chroococcidiopsis cubana SAG 39.79]|nr:hypothetical protein [Chroococcidiopsis cubana SAG 39.79]